MAPRAPKMSSDRAERTAAGQTVARRTSSPNGAPRLSLREAQKQLTRSRLLDAAAELFATRGYAATTIEEIATSAGATRATFYLHFPSKSDVVHGFYEALVTYDSDYADLLEIARDPTQDALREWLERFIGGLEEQHHYWEGLREASGADPEARAAATGDFARSTEVLADRLAEARDWDHAHARLVATVLKRQLDVTNDEWIRSNWEDEQAALFETLAAMWLAALID
jgi:AcrR family transcriptional regulator